MVLGVEPRPPLYCEPTTMAPKRNSGGALRACLGALCVARELVHLTMAVSASVAASSQHLVAPKYVTKSLKLTLFSCYSS